MKVLTKLQGKYFNHGIEYNSDTDDVTIGYIDEDGEIIADDFDDDFIVMKLNDYLRITSAFKNEMLVNGFGPKVKGY